MQNLGAMSRAKTPPLRDYATFFASLLTEDFIFIVILLVFFKTVIKNSYWQKKANFSGTNGDLFQWQVIIYH